MGRPSKLTPELTDAVCALVAEGLDNEDACLGIGIGETTFYRWKARGTRAKRGKFREFWESLKKAEIGFRRARLGKILKAELPSIEKRVFKKRVPKGLVNGVQVFEETTETFITEKPPDWKPSAWLLERRFPHKYGRQVTEHAGEVGVKHSGKVEATVSRFQWPDGTIHEKVLLETPEEVEAKGGRVPDEAQKDGKHESSPDD